MIWNRKLEQQKRHPSKSIRIHEQNDCWILEDMRAMHHPQT
jgi:hypothetical protein